MSDLNNKVALITGASRGIGASTARHFAAEGAKVIMLARSEAAIADLAAEIRTTGGDAIGISGDVSRYEVLQQAVDTAVQTFGRLDILVNNAGVIDPVARLADSDPDTWSKIVDINLKGVYFGLRAAIPEMLKSGGGVIINISSGAATGALEGWSHYCATKAAVLSLTKCAAKEYGSQGIRESGINPVSQLDPSVHIPADWVAKAIAFLCSEAGDAYAGGDFSLKTDEGRRRVGLPLLDG